MEDTKNYFLKRPFLTIVLLILFIPYPFAVIPEWQIKVTDGDGTPLSNVELEQVWSYNSYSGSNYDTRISDAHGNVIFPARRLFRPLILRFFSNGLDVINFVFSGHGSRIGGHAMVHSKLSDNWILYKSGDELKTTFVVK